MGAVVGFSASTVSRWFRHWDVKPHLTETVKSSTDVGFIRNFRDIRRLYPNVPDHETVLCFDKGPQVQALYRTQPQLAAALGCVESWTRSGVRHGTMTLLEVLDIFTGKVATNCKT